MDSDSKRRSSRGWFVGISSAALLMAVAASLSWWWIWPLAGNDPGARIEAVRTSLTAIIGAAGLVTLLLAARRQWHQEQVHEDNRYDAEQRRITEQYIQAVEQLGHERAPVRLGGLYGLDRLGRDHADQREKIAEVWCAYLRRRYTPPADILDLMNPDTEGDERAELSEAERESAEEYEVRATAQRLLADHLKDPRPEAARDGTRPPESMEYWHLAQVNLAGATLVNVDFEECWLPNFVATRARFHGAARFNQAHFGAAGAFGGARFRGHAGFFRVHFERNAFFWGARFGGEVMFGEAEFKAHAYFNGTRYAGRASFRQAHFTGHAGFAEVTCDQVDAFDMTGALSETGPPPPPHRELPPGWTFVRRNTHWEVAHENSPDGIERN